MDDEYVERVWNLLKNAMQRTLKKEDSFGLIFSEELYR